jgi:RHS repeat-associated protein
VDSQSPGSPNGIDAYVHSYLGDANYNITTLVNTGGDALERYVYTPYGVLTIYDATWSNVRSVSRSANAHTYTGRQLDAETGLDYYRHRMYHAQLGSFGSRDPVGYRAGVNLVEYVWDNPTTRTDPSGEQFVPGTPNSPWNPGPIKSTPGPILLPVPPTSMVPSGRSIWEIIDDLMGLIPGVDGFVFCYRGGYASCTHQCWDAGCGFDWAPMCYAEIEQGDWIAATTFTCDEFSTMVQLMPWNHRCGSRKWA